MKIDQSTKPHEHVFYALETLPSSPPTFRGMCECGETTSSDKDEFTIWIASGHPARRPK